jgi:hypothetical protein
MAAHRHFSNEKAISINFGRAPSCSARMGREGLCEYRQAAGAAAGSFKARRPSAETPDRRLKLALQRWISTNDGKHPRASTHIGERNRKEATVTDITLICLSLLMAIFTMMVAAEVGQRRRSRH